MGTVKDDQVVVDMGAAIDYLKTLKEVKPSFGTVGFCMGGRVAFLAACRNPAVRATAPYYGGRMVKASAPGAKAPIDYVEGLKAPVLAFSAVRMRSFRSQKLTSFATRSRRRQAGRGGLLSRRRPRLHVRRSPVVSSGAFQGSVEQDHRVLQTESRLKRIERTLFKSRSRAGHRRPVFFLALVAIAAVAACYSSDYRRTMAANVALLSDLSTNSRITAAAISSSTIASSRPRRWASSTTHSTRPMRFVVDAA